MQGTALSHACHLAKSTKPEVCEQISGTKPRYPELCRLLSAASACLPSGSATPPRRLGTDLHDFVTRSFKGEASSCLIQQLKAWIRTHQWDRNTAVSSVWLRPVIGLGTGAGNTECPPLRRSACVKRDFRWQERNRRIMFERTSTQAQDRRSDQPDSRFDRCLQAASRPQGHEDRP